MSNVPDKVKERMRKAQEKMGLLERLALILNADLNYGYVFKIINPRKNMVAITTRTLFSPTVYLNSQWNRKRLVAEALYRVSYDYIALPLLLMSKLKIFNNSNIETTCKKCVLDALAFDSLSKKISDWLAEYYAELYLSLAKNIKETDTSEIDTKALEKTMKVFQIFIPCEKLNADSIFIKKQLLHIGIPPMLHDRILTVYEAYKYAIRIPNLTQKIPSLIAIFKKLYGLIRDYLELLKNNMILNILQKLSNVIKTKIALKRTFTIRSFLSGDKTKDKLEKLEKELEKDKKLKKVLEDLEDTYGRSLNALEKLENDIDKLKDSLEKMMQEKEKKIKEKPKEESQRETKEEKEGVQIVRGLTAEEFLDVIEKEIKKQELRSNIENNLIYDKITQELSKEISKKINEEMPRKGNIHPFDVEFKPPKDFRAEDLERLLKEIRDIIDKIGHIPDGWGIGTDISEEELRDWIRRLWEAWKQGKIRKDKDDSLGIGKGGLFAGKGFDIFKDWEEPLTEKPVNLDEVILELKTLTGVDRWYNEPFESVLMETSTIYALTNGYIIPTNPPIPAIIPGKAFKEGKQKRKILIAIVDLSGSMASFEQKIRNVLFTTLVSERIRKVAIIGFGDYARWIVKPTTDIQYAIARVKGVFTHGGTEICPAFRLLAKYQDLLYESDGWILIITDGFIYDLHKLKYESILSRLKEVVIYYTPYCNKRLSAILRSFGINVKDRFLISPQTKM